MASWQPQAAAFTIPAYEASVALPVALTPRTFPAPASEATPTKTGALASDRSTEPGSPSGATEGTSEEDNMPTDVLPPVLQLAELAQHWGPVPPPPPTPTKLDLHAIIFEKAKDPISTHLLQLIKGSQ